VSKPQIVLPEDVQQLLDRLGKQKPGVELPRSAPAPEIPTELLDYLLGA
jgi:hypothetical protein